MFGLGTSCCCAPPCSIFANDYSTDQIATLYDEVSGDWAVGSGVLTTDDDGAILIADATGTTGHGKVSAVGQVDTYGGSFRVIGSYVDSSNYVFIEVTVNNGSGASHVKLWQRVSGTNTQLGSTKTFTGALNTNYTASVCWNGIHAIGNASVVTTDLYDAYTGTGNKAGVGATANGGTATLDTFSFTNIRQDQSGCPGCGVSGCGSCAVGTVPLRIQLDLGGFGSVIDGTYIIEFYGEVLTLCGYQYDMPMPYTAVCQNNGAPFFDQTVFYRILGTLSGGGFTVNVQVVTTIGGLISTIAYFELTTSTTACDEGFEPGTAMTLYTGSDPVVQPKDFGSCTGTTGTCEATIL